MAGGRLTRWLDVTPGATTLAASDLKTTQATLNASVNPKGLSTTYRFEYGPTTAYGTNVPVPDKSVGSGSSAVEVSQALSGLQSNTTYHYRVMAKSEAGTQYGKDQTFKTLKVPTVSTQPATKVQSEGTTLNALVNPQGSATEYRFEYGKTTAYGASVPLPAKSAGSGEANVAISESVSGLESNTTYHFRIMASSAAGTVYGTDQAFTTSFTGQVDAMPLTEPFNGSAESQANFESKWSVLSWAAGYFPSGYNSTGGWWPFGTSYPTANGSYYETSFNDSGLGSASVVTMTAGPTCANCYVSLWLDMPTPGSSPRAGYELRLTYVSAGVYNVSLSKWQGGTQTSLASQASYPFANGGSMALVDQGGSVLAWTNTGSGFSLLLGANDLAFSAGYPAIEGSGNSIRLNNFKAGALGG